MTDTRFGSATRSFPRMGFSVPTQIATIHLNAAQRAVPPLERLYYDSEAELYGGDTLPEAGMVSVPADPGLGLDPDPEVIERYRVA